MSAPLPLILVITSLSCGVFASSPADTTCVDQLDDGLLRDEVSFIQTSSIVSKPQRKATPLEASEDGKEVVRRTEHEAIKWIVANAKARMAGEYVKPFAPLEPFAPLGKSDLDAIGAHEDDEDIQEFGEHKEDSDSSPEPTNLRHHHRHHGHCEKDTGGTCRFFSCKSSRGPTKCSSGHCLCKRGSCAVDGQCRHPYTTGDAEQEADELADFIKFHLSYIGVGQKEGSTKKFGIEGFRPNDKKKHPVYIYLAGTFDDFAVPQNMILVKEMAKRGFVGATVDYANDGLCLELCNTNATCAKWATMGSGSEVTFYEKARTIRKALDKLCALDAVDCSKGVTMMGHSQGGFMAQMVAMEDNRVTAIHPMGTGHIIIAITEEVSFALETTCLLDKNVDKKLSKKRRRYTNGIADDLSHHKEKGDNKALEALSGYKCPVTRKKQTVNCIQKGGSGYYLVGEDQYDEGDKALVKKYGQNKLAGHNFFGTHDPVTKESVFLPAYTKGTAPWCMHPTLDWLASTAEEQKSSESKEQKSSESKEQKSSESKAM